MVKWTKWDAVIADERFYSSNSFFLHDFQDTVDIRLE
jgi:hypothetical protein